jgi:signal transduction histidine kinase
VSVVVPSPAQPPRHHRGVALCLGLAAAAAAVAWGIAVANGQTRGSTTTLAVTTIVAGCTFVTAGIVGWLRRPANRTGPLMIAAGFILLASSLAQASQALPFTIGLALAALPAAILVHLVLAYPDGRLHSRSERYAVGLAYVDTVALQLLMLMFMGFEMQSGGPYPDNLLLVDDNMQVHNAIMSTERAVGFVLALWVGALLVRRWQAASSPLRREVVPLFATGGAVIALFAIAFVAASPVPTFSHAFSTAAQVALAIVPVAFLLGLFDARLARAGVSDLVVELGRTPAPGRLRDALARALGDPSLELAYWIPETGSYVGIDGHPVTPEADERHAVTLLERGGRRVAALVHDPALAERRELLDAVSSAAGLALENERLQAELRSQLEELRHSRARIVEAGDTARRKLERNLHDGAQQRLVALSVALSLAQAKLASDPETAAGLLASARDELAVGLAELREIARGLHPAILSSGLEAALAGVADRSPVPAELHVDVGERLAEPVEAAAYYVVSEALTNVARYANATAVSVRAVREPGQLRVEVADNGIGGATLDGGSGLLGLRDRVEAVGGRLEVESPRGDGTRITAWLPLEPLASD